MYYPSLSWSSRYFRGAVTYFQNSIVSTKITRLKIIKNYQTDGPIAGVGWGGGLICRNLWYVVKILQVVMAKNAFYFLIVIINYSICTIYQSIKQKMHIHRM